MNTTITSREAILNASKELVRKQGWTALNIRTVAASCGVSVGSIYNYFDSKSDLTAATVESIWCDIFHFPESSEKFDSFCACVEWIFDSMKRGDEMYPGFFSLHSVSFIGEEKPKGRQLMAQSWKHIQDKLYLTLTNDNHVRTGAFNETFTAQKFTEIIFSLIISALLQQNYDHTVISEMIQRLLY